MVDVPHVGRRFTHPLDACALYAPVLPPVDIYAVGYVLSPSARDTVLSVPYRSDIASATFLPVISTHPPCLLPFLPVALLGLLFG